MSVPTMAQVVNKVADVLPDNPSQIIDGAKKAAKVKKRFIASPEGIIDTFDDALKTAGATAGVGVSALGAGINKTFGPNAIGRTLKRQGLLTAADGAKSRSAGAMVLGAGSIPLIVAGDQLNRRINSPDLDKVYGPGASNFSVFMHPMHI